MGLWQRAASQRNSTLSRRCSPWAGSATTASSRRRRPVHSHPRRTNPTAPPSTSSPLPSTFRPASVTRTRPGSASPAGSAFGLLLPAAHVPPPAQFVRATLGGRRKVEPTVAVEVRRDHLIGVGPLLLEDEDRPWFLAVSGVAEPDDLAGRPPRG